MLAKPTQSCVFWPKLFFLEQLKKQSFLPKQLDLLGLLHGDFQVFGSKQPQVRTTRLCRTQNTYGTLKGRQQVNLQEKINHNQNLSEFSETKATKLEKGSLIFSRCNPFPSWPSAAQDTCFYYQSTSGIILNKSRPLFLGFHWYEFVFRVFTVTLKMVTEPL